MKQKVFVYDPTTSDKLSSVRGIGRYLQILKENFPEWSFSSQLPPTTYPLQSIFINPFFNFLKPPVTFKKIAKKQIAVIHDLIPLKYPSHFPTGIKGSIYILLNKLILRNYDLIITDSEASKLDIVKILGVKENMIKVIYPCLPQSFLNPESGIRNPKQFLNSEFVSKLDIRASDFCLYVGDATWNKNLANLARAIKIANVPTIFVGKVFKNTSIFHPWQKELKEFFELTKDDKRFIFPGFVPDSELFKLYELSSLNLLLSSAEGFGFSYLEAAQFGCPSLLADIPVFKEVSGGQAIFADQNNPQTIAEKIKIMYSDKNLRNKIGSDANKRSEFFNPKKFRKEFLSVIPAPAFATVNSGGNPDISGSPFSRG